MKKADAFFMGTRGGVSDVVDESKFRFFTLAALTPTPLSSYGRAMLVPPGEGLIR